MASTTHLHHAHGGTSLSATIGTWQDAKSTLSELGLALLQQLAPPTHDRVVITPPAVDHDFLGEQPTPPYGFKPTHKARTFSHTDTPHEGLDTSELHFAG